MISYQSDGVPMPDIKHRETTAWIRKVAALHDRRVGSIGYMFVNDENRKGQSPCAVRRTLARLK